MPIYSHYKHYSSPNISLYVNRESNAVIVVLLLSTPVKIEFLQKRHDISN